MRIAVFHNAPYGGAKRAAHDLTRRLSANHQIEAYSLSTAEHDFCDIRAFSRAHHVFDFLPRPTFSSPIGRLNNLQRWRDLRDLDALCRRIARQINRSGCDVFLAASCALTTIPVILRHVTIPSVCYIEEPFGPKFQRNLVRPHDMKRPYGRWFDRLDPLIALYSRRMSIVQERSLAAATRLLANSRFTRERLEESFDAEVFECRLGVDPAVFFPAPETAREDFVVSVGELTPRKGFDFLVRSLGHIRPGRRPPLKLVCNVIDPREHRFVTGLAAQCGVDLEILYRLDSSQLRSIYSQARLFVYSPVQEPFGLAPLEAMACGTPVVGVREGGVQESVVHERTGLLTDRNPRTFGAAVAHLMDDPTLAAQYGRQGRAHVCEHWSWHGPVSEFERHLHAVSVRN